MYIIDKITIKKHLNIMIELWKYKSKEQELKMIQLLESIVISAYYIINKKNIIKHLNIIKRLWEFNSKHWEKNII